MGFFENIEVKSNLILVARERGKIVCRREGHNIWVDLGREYLASLIGYSSYSPDTPELDYRVKYMGLGIGGTRQLAPGIANSPPMSTDYPGTNAQTDTDPTVTTLERPVRVTSAPLWLGQVQPVAHPSPSQAEFVIDFLTTEISYGSYLTVPLSEVGLFTSAANPAVGTNTVIAYDTFDTISKTSAFSLEVTWTVRF